MADKATREALGETLVELAAEGRDDIVVLEADLAKATTTAKFGAAYPDRFFDAGIAEQNMTGMAAGLAVGGKTAFTASFAVFATGRAYDQVRNSVCYANLDVKLCPTHSGITVGPDGGTHQMIEDIALMRVLPNMRVLVPADYHAAKAAIRIASETPGPFYVRLGRLALPEIYPADMEFELGRAYVLREGTDVTLVTHSYATVRALAAAERLASEHGVSAEVVDLRSLRPLDIDTVIESVKKTNRLVTVEQGWPVCSIGSEIASQVVEKAFDWLDAPPAKVAGKDVPMPYAANLEKLALPSVAEVVDAAKAVMYR